MASIIRIFSRSGESEYRWLLDNLREEGTVSPFVITNRNYSLFCEEIYKCSFAILYHSRNRGRVNITDVTDSLYDGEVNTISEALGKDRVITVIDDLDDSSDESKNRILGHQPTLKNLTRGVFLFTAKDKANMEVLRQKMEPIKLIISRSVRKTHVKSNADKPYDQRSRQRPVHGAAKPEGRLMEQDYIPVNVPEKGSEEARPEKKGNMKKIVISFLSCVVFWNTCYFPGSGNGLVALLWAAVMGRVLYNPGSTPVLPLVRQGRFVLSCTLTLLSIYDTYHRPSIFNVANSAMWISSCLMYSWSRRSPPISEPIREVISYGPVLLTFWKGWQQYEAETALQMISQYFLRSPGILAAEGI